MSDELNDLLKALESDNEEVEEESDNDLDALLKSLEDGNDDGSDSDSDSDADSDSDSDSDSDEEILEVRATLPNGKEYLIQNGIPFKIIDQKKGEYFSGSRPKVKFLTSSIKQWFNPDDVDEDSMCDELKEIAAQLYKISGTSTADTACGEGENLFEKRVKKDCGPCKGTGLRKGKECPFCHGKGTN